MKKYYEYTQKLKEYTKTAVEKGKNIISNFHLTKTTAIICLVVIAASVLFTSTWPTKASAANEAPAETEMKMYVAKNDFGNDVVVYENGKYATDYSVDKKGNVVNAESGKVVMKAKNVETAVIVKVPVEVQVEVEKKQDEAEEEHVTFPFAARISGRGVRLRAVATTEGRIIAEFSGDVPVTVIGADGDWYMVEVDESQGLEENVGYVHGQYIIRSRRG